MKKLVFFISLLFLFYALFPSSVLAKDVEIDEDNFPDEAFMDYVQKNFDTNKNGFLEDDEVKSVKVIPVGFNYKVTSDDYGKITVTTSNNSFPEKISNFTGIEYFVNLEMFSCQSNDIKKLDLAKNIELKVLFCGNNQLKDIDLRKNTKLEFLDCSYNKLKDIDVDENLKLKGLFCNNNQITEDLYADKNRDLLYFDCSYNEIEDFGLYEPESIKSADRVFSGDRWISIDVKVHVSNDMNFLTYLKCDHNNIMAIDLVDMADNLLWLKCDHNNLDTRLFAYDAENLVWLECNDNKIKVLMLENKKLRYLKCDNNLIQEIDAGLCRPIEQLICDNNAINEFYMPRRAEKFVYLSCSSNDIEYMDNVPSCLKYIDFSNNKVNDSYFLKKGTSLQTINCSHNKLEELDLSKITDLRVLSCDNNHIPDISFANNPSIKSFSGLSQTIHGQCVYSSSELKGYPYEYDLTDLVSTKTDFSRIIDVHAFRADNSSIKIERNKTDNEMIYLTEKPAYMTYKYKPDAKLGKNYLEVTLFFDDENDDYGSSNNDSNDTDTQNENNNRVSRGGGSSGCNSGVTLAGIIALSLISVLKKKK